MSNLFKGNSDEFLPPSPFLRVFAQTLFRAIFKQSVDFMNVSALNATDMSQEEIQCCFQKGKETLIPG